MKRWGVVLFAAWAAWCIAWALAWQGVRAEGETPWSEAQYFEQTGHYVAGPFLDRYRATPFAEVVYGYPLTEAIRQEDGSYLQYFQRAVMVWSPADDTVRLLPLGQMFYQVDQPRARKPDFGEDGPGCEVVDPESPPVCLLFRVAYDRFGGKAILGKPVSPLVIVDGWLVQYFELARMEFHPEQPLGQRIRFTPLGEWWFYRQAEDPRLLLPPMGNQIPVAAQQRLRVRAFVQHPVLTAGEGQEVFVTVLDGVGRPIQGATVEVWVSPLAEQGQPSGPALSNATNAQGICAIFLPWESLSAAAQQSSWLRVQVRVETIGLQTWQSSSYVDFRVWGR